MNPQDMRPDDREALSALFDGELQGEARLFALRRLGHDADWQRACGQWQVIGDALRRDAAVAAPADFATRVRAGVAAEAPSRAVPAPAGRSRVRWIGGGALAASVALAFTIALFPSGREPEAPAAETLATRPAVPATPVATASPPAAVTVTSQPRVVAPAVVAAAVPPDAVAAPASATPRIASAPRRATRAASPAPRTVRDADEAAVLVGQTGNPFNLGRDEALTARPWPRTGVSGGAFTAGYGPVRESAGERPSFYPFEPRPQGDAAQAPAP